MTETREAELTIRIVEMIAKQLKVSVDEVEMHHSLTDDLGADSLDTAELMMEVEEVFEIEITDDEVETLQTVQETVDFVSKALTD